MTTNQKRRFHLLRRNASTGSLVVVALESLSKYGYYLFATNTFVNLRILSVNKTIADLIET